MRKTALDSISFKRLPAHDTVARTPALDAANAHPHDDSEMASLDEDAKDAGTPEGARKAAQTRAGGGGPKHGDPTGRPGEHYVQTPQGMKTFKSPGKTRSGKPYVPPPGAFGGPPAGGYSFPKRK